MEETKSKTKKKIYISGGISESDFEESQIMFDNAQHDLEQDGYKVVNPLNHVPRSAIWEQRIVKHIELLFTCDAIYMLPNWKNSICAKIEHLIASERGMEVMFY